MFIPDKRIFAGAVYVNMQQLAYFPHGAPLARKAVSTFEDPYTEFNVFPPKGTDNLFGYNSGRMVTTLQYSSGSIKTLCTTYTVDGGKGKLPKYLPIGPLPSFDGSHYYAGTTNTTTPTGTSTSSTLFALGTVTAATATCDLRSVVTIDTEIVQAVKLPGNKFLVELTLVAVPNNSVSKIGILDTNGSYTNLIGPSGAQVIARKCCDLVPDWENSTGFIAYAGTDGKNHGVVYNKGTLQEVYNSGATGQLTVDMWVNDFKGTKAILGGGNIIAGGATELVAVDTATKLSYVVGAYNSDTIPGIKPNFYFQRGNAAVTKEGVLYFEAYQPSDQSSHLYKATVPGFTEFHPPIVRYFSASTSEITAGDSVGLIWSIQDADAVAIDQGIGRVPPEGSLMLFPYGNNSVHSDSNRTWRHYILHCHRNRHPSGYPPYVYLWWRCRCSIF